MKVFAKRFYGFDPAAYPFVGFGLAGNRDALIAASSPGDLLVFVGTQDAPTGEADRGRLLGVVEFGRIALDLEEVTDRSNLRPFDLKADGSLAWPKGLPIRRPWPFTQPRFKLVDILREQLTFEATVRAVLLDEADTKAVLAIPRREIPLTLPPKVSQLMALHQALKAGRPTTGPVPASWETNVVHSVDGEAWTYALQFGRRAIWKVGWTQDTNERVRTINEHIPFEETGERWVLRFRQRWPTSRDAHAMEQRVLEMLHLQRTEGERVRCTETVLQAAWAACLI